MKYKLKLKPGKVVFTFGPLSLDWQDIFISLLIVIGSFSLVFTPLSSSSLIVSILGFIIFRDILIAKGHYKRK